MYAVVSTRKADGKQFVVEFDNGIDACNYFNKVNWNKKSSHKVVENYGTENESVYCEC